MNNENPLFQMLTWFIRNASLPVQVAAGAGAGAFTVFYIIGWVTERIEGDEFVQQVGATHQEIKDLRAEVEKMSASINLLNEMLGSKS